MLRFLSLLVGFSIVFFSSLIMAQTIDYVEPSRDEIDQQAFGITRALDEVEVIMNDGTIDKILSEEQARIDLINFTGKGLNIELPDFLETARDDRYLAKALAAGEQIQNDVETSNNFNPIILISFSMPEAQIKALISEATKVGAAIAIRGLVDNDFSKTASKIAELSVAGDGGFLVDPTLFRRFSVETVPAFILPLEPFKQCTSVDGCEMTDHVMATGSATLKYFLDLVHRTQDENAKKIAGGWLSMYEG